MTTIQGIVVEGHGIASGKNEFHGIGSTIKAQYVAFKERGFDMEAHDLYYGTINLDISPYTYEFKNSLHTFENVKWYPTQPAETFSLFNCILHTPSGDVEAFIYHPHPETKPIEFLGHNMLEILAPRVAGIQYGQSLKVTVKPEQVAFTLDEKAAKKA